MSPSGPAPQAPSPRVSVVVPVRNGAETLGTCLRSLLAQDYPRDRWELLVVDNASTDATPEICRSLGVTPLPESRPGPGVARNRGIEAATGDVVVFTDADCEHDADWLRRLVAALDGSPAIVGDIEPVPGGNRYARARAALHRSYLDECRRRAAREELGHLDTANAAVWKSVLDRTGGFDPRVFAAEDSELGVRIAERVGPIRFVPEVVVRHRYPSRLLPSIRKAMLIGRMWERLPTILEPDVLKRHFPEVPGILERARAEAASPSRLLRLRLRLAREVAGCAVTPTFSGCLACYTRATRLAIRLGAAEAMAETVRFGAPSGP